MKQFPDAESYTDVYHKCNLLTNKVRTLKRLWAKKVKDDVQAEIDHTHAVNDSQTVMAHGCHLSDKELDLFRETGASLSHCPNSNFS